MYGSSNIVLCVSTSQNLEMVSILKGYEKLQSLKKAIIFTKEEEKKLYNEILADQVVLYTRTDGEIT